MKMGFNWSPILRDVENGILMLRVIFVGELPAFFHSLPYRFCLKPFMISFYGFPFFPFMPSPLAVLFAFRPTLLSLAQFGFFGRGLPTTALSLLS
jgi:hypothetical protein